MTLNRRTFAFGATAGIAGIIAARSAPVIVRAQSSTLPGSIAFVRSGDIWSWSGGDAQRLLDGGDLTSPRWSPGGDQVLYVRTGNSFSDLYIYSLSTGGDTRLTYNENVDAQIGSPDYVSNSIWAIDPSWSLSGAIGYSSDYYTPYGKLSLHTMPWAGAQPQLYTNDPLDQDVTSISISSSGAFAGFVTRTYDANGNYVPYVGVRDLDSWEVRQLIWEEGGSYDPAMEPNGSRVACTIRRGGISDIWLIDRLDADPLRITEGKNAMRPVWHPDASYLAWYQVVDFKFECWGASVNGTRIGEPQRLFNFDDIDASSGMSWIW